MNGSGECVERRGSGPYFSVPGHTPVIFRSDSLFLHFIFKLTHISIFVCQAVFSSGPGQFHTNNKRSFGKFRGATFFVLFNKLKILLSLFSWRSCSSSMPYLRWMSPPFFSIFVCFFICEMVAFYFDNGDICVSFQETVVVVVMIMKVIAVETERRKRGYRFKW